MSFSINPDMAARLIDGCYYIVDPGNRMLHMLNDTGTYIYSELKKGSEPETIIRGLCGEFEVSRGEAERDMEEFTEDLREKGILL